MDAYIPNPRRQVEVRFIGTSKEPLLVIDDYLADPHALIAAAAASPHWKDLPPGGYPGKRAPLPRAYVRAVLRDLDGAIREKLVGTAQHLDRFECSFSLVTRPPEQLSPLQLVPHIDIANPGRVAILHYICGPGFGGTAFFRQQGTELEQIAPEDRARYIAARTRGLTDLGADSHYPGPETPGYERTAFVTAKFNRLVAYRSFTLHSGIIDRPEALSDDPGKGRLTANFFADYAPSPVTPG